MPFMVNVLGTINIYIYEKFKYKSCAVVLFSYKPEITEGSASLDLDLIFSEKVQ